MLRLAVAGVLLLSLAPPALAQPRQAAPACTAPPGPLQAMVCADAELRAADRRLRELERAVAGATARPATMAHRARNWQRRLEAGERDGAGGPTRPHDRDDLLHAYQDRAEDLDEQLRQDRAMRRLEQRRDANGRPLTTFPRPADLERTCLGGVLRDCRVSGAGMAIGEDGRTRVLWQAQRGFTEADGLRAGIVMLAEARGGWRLLGWSFEGHRYDAPRVIGSEGPRLLHLPGLGGGSGTVNTDLLYRLGAEGWQEVEAESWWHAMPAHLPPGLEVWQAVQYDFEEMTARTPLWRETDGNCCPSGGAAAFDLRIEGQSVVLVAASLDAVARTARSSPDVCPAERATYRLNAPVELIAELRGGWPGAGAASDLLLRVRLPASGTEHWFQFGAAQGYGGLSIGPVEPPGPRTMEEGVQSLDYDDDLQPLLDVYPISAELVVLANPPQSGAPAPRHLFTPGLGKALHYARLPGQTEREHMPYALWTLSECRAR